MPLILILLIATGILSRQFQPVEGIYRVTFYWTVFPEDVEPSGKQVQVVDAQKRELAWADEELVKQIAMEGSGYLPDGRLLNIACACPYPDSRFIVVDTSKTPWGYDAQKKPLIPFKSIAVDPTLVPAGTTVYIEAFRGLKLSETLVHDGCFVASDTGYTISDRHIDIYTGTYASYLIAIYRLKNIERVKLRRASDGECRNG